jgi:O-methyltransferase involved in polyketide biosynthesis
MKREPPSLTALGNAAVRALESEKKQNEKICDDSYARKFVPTWLYYLYKSAIDGKEIKRAIIYYREKFTFGIEKGRIQDYLKACRFQQIREVNNEELERMYCTGKNRGLRVLSGLAIVSANIAR